MCSDVLCRCGELHEISVVALGQRNLRGAVGLGIVETGLLFDALELTRNFIIMLLTLTLASADAKPYLLPAIRVRRWFAFDKCGSDQWR
jgi:hypothetical protein